MENKCGPLEEQAASLPFKEPWQAAKKLPPTLVSMLGTAWEPFAAASLSFCPVEAHCSIQN